MRFCGCAWSSGDAPVGSDSADDDDDDIAVVVVQSGSRLAVRTGIEVLESSIADLAESMFRNGSSSDGPMGRPVLVLPSFVVVVSSLSILDSRSNERIVESFRVTNLALRTAVSVVVVASAAGICSASSFSRRVSTGC